MENAWKCYLNLNPNFILFYIIKNTLKLWGWFQLYLKLIKKKKKTHIIFQFSIICVIVYFFLLILTFKIYC